jgi:hypothetical protein
MNERIRELAEQAGFLAVGDFDNPVLIIDGPDRIVSLELTKFAELIVLECMDVGSQWADGLIDAKHYAFVNKKIKEHFGVEQ